MERITKRTICLDGQSVSYTLERKQVKNLNLHVRKDGSVYVSANALVPVEQVDAFLISKTQFILNAQKRFREQAQFAPQPKQYVSGESFFIQGRSLRLQVNQSAKERIYSDGVHIFLEVKDPSDFVKKQRMVCRFMDNQCRTVFEEVVREIYPTFQKYGVAMPALRIRAIIGTSGITVDLIPEPKQIPLLRLALYCERVLQSFKPFTHLHTPHFRR